MKHHTIPIYLALFVALGLALMFTAPVFADDAPPPEQPAAPEAAAPPAPEGGGESGGDAEAPAEALSSGAPAPLAITGGEIGILSGQAWYWLGGVQQFFSSAQDAIDDIKTSGVLPTDRLIYLEDGTFAGFELDGTLSVLNQMKGVLGFNGAFTGYDNEDASVITSDMIYIHDTVAGFTLQGLKVISGDVLISNNTGTLTLNSVDISGGDNSLDVTGHNGAINADSISVTGGEGAFMDNSAGAAANITVINSAFVNNIDADMDPTGLYVHSSGIAKVSGIDANTNEYFGLYLDGDKGVEISNTYTANNGKHGVLAYSAGIAKVTVKDLQTHYNGDDGLHIETLGDINLTQIAASNNGQNDDGAGGNGFGIAVGTWPGTPGGRNLVGKDLGAWNNHDTGLDLKVSGTTTLSGIFTANNWGTGTWVYSSGAITLNGVTSSNDGAVGIDLVNLDAATPQPIKILNTYASNDVNNAQGSYFGLSSGLPGVSILSHGAVSITGLSTHDNVNGGMVIGNPTDLAGAVTLTETGASSNGEFGILVLSKDSITWKTAWSVNNNWYGAQLDNTSAPTPKPVTIENAWFFNNHGGSGLEIQSKGAVTLKNANAGDNNAYGIYIVNDSGVANVSVAGSLPQPLEIGRNGEAGLYIDSNGTVTASYINAYENGRVFNIDGDGILIMNDGALTPKAVTLSSLDLWGNEENGLYVEASGAITVTNISSRDNGGMGAFLEGNGTGAAVKVLRTAQWHNDFSRNGEHGLYIEAYGPVTLARINAGENGWQAGPLDDLYDGVHVDNCRDTGGYTCSGKWAVTLNITSGWNHDFSRNENNGLYIGSGGAVKVSNINAGENGHYGVVVDTNWNNAAGAVTVASVGGYQNNFWRNGLDGLRIAATGAISVTNFQANENGRHGISVSNHMALTPAAITLTNGNANDNRNGHGIYARALGNIKVVDVDAQNNDVHYASIAFDTTVPEKLMGWLWDGGSWGDGDVYEFEVSGGPIAINLHVVLEFTGNIYWEYDNAGSWDPYGGCTGGTGCTFNYGSVPDGYYRVRITGIDWDNQGNYRISLNDNDTEYTSYDFVGGSGLWLNNDYPGATGTVTVAGGPISWNVDTHNNGSTGTYIRSRKAITLTRLHSNNNGGFGLDADNCMYNGVCQYVAPVTLNGYSSNLSDNQLGGLEISSEGVVNLQNLDAQNNHLTYGARIFAGNLTIKTTNPLPWSSNFNNNGGGGLWLFSNGTITLDRVVSNNNGGQGIWLSNTVAATPKAVSITNTYVQDNYGTDDDGVSGLRVETGGAVTLKNVQVNGNHGGGAYIDNRGLTSTNVLVQQSKFENNNPDGGPFHFGDPEYKDFFDGINILTNASVTWNSSGASFNGSGDGVVIGENPTGVTLGSVTVLTTYGNNDFFGNGETGFGVLGASSVSIAGMRGEGNGTRGLGIWTATGGSITVNNAVLSRNAMQGVKIENGGNGLIKLSNISGFENALGSSNDFAGAEIYTNGGTVSIINSAFHHNGDWGIYVNLNGGVILPVFTGTTWNSNNWDGAGFDGTDNPNVEVVP